MCEFIFFRLITFYLQPTFKAVADAEGRIHAALKGQMRSLQLEHEAKERSLKSELERERAHLKYALEKMGLGRGYADST